MPALDEVSTPLAKPLGLARVPLNALALAHAVQLARCAAGLRQPEGGAVEAGTDTAVQARRASGRARARRRKMASRASTTPEPWRCAAAKAGLQEEWSVS